MQTSKKDDMQKQTFAVEKSCWELTLYEIKIPMLHLKEWWKYM